MVEKSLTLDDENGLVDSIRYLFMWRTDECAGNCGGGTERFSFLVVLNESAWTGISRAHSFVHPSLPFTMKSRISALDCSVNSVELRCGRVGDNMDNVRI